MQLFLYLCRVRLVSLLTCLRTRSLGLFFRFGLFLLSVGQPLYDSSTRFRVFGLSFDSFGSLAGPAGVLFPCLPSQ